MNGEYEWIKVSPLRRDHIYQLETVEALSEVRTVFVYKFTILPSVIVFHIAKFLN